MKWYTCSQAQITAPGLADAARRRAFQESRYCVPVGAGADGAPAWLDFQWAAHVLITGTTGSGKSTAVNAIITALAVRNSPATAQFIMIDPKRVELRKWRNLPHLLRPIATDPAAAVDALTAARANMEKRFQTMELYDVDDVAALPFTCPRLFVVVDEFASVSSDKRTAAAAMAIMKDLARLGRAAGVHLILATQYARADVVDTQIRANVPARVAFRTMTATESKVAIDAPGAENLRGPGAGFLRDASGDVQRIRGLYVDRRQIDTVVKFYTDQM